MHDDAFEQYVETALWSSVHFADESDDGTPFDEVDAELAPETETTMRQELDAFLSDPDIANDLALMSVEQAAHDFWLTRNHHGAGFWDRGLGAAGERLTRAAYAYGWADLYLGDDGKIYQA